MTITEVSEKYDLSQDTAGAVNLYYERLNRVFEDFVKCLLIEIDGTIIIKNCS